MGSPLFLIVPRPYVPLCLCFICFLHLNIHSFFSFIPLWGSEASLLSRVFPIELWDSLSAYVHPGIACLASWASDWLGAFWGD